MRIRSIPYALYSLLLLSCVALGQEDPEAAKVKAWIMDYLTSIRSVQCEYMYSAEVYGHGSQKMRYMLKARGDEYLLGETIEENVSMGTFSPGSKFTTNYLAGSRKLLNEIVGDHVSVEINLKGPKVPEHLLGPRLLMGKGGHDTSLLEILGAPGYAKIFRFGDTKVFSYRRTAENEKQLKSIDVYICDEKIVQVDWCFRPLCPMEDDLRETESDFDLRTIPRTMRLSDYVTVNGVSFPCNFRGMTYGLKWGDNYSQMVALDEQGKISNCDFATAIMAGAEEVPKSEEIVMIDPASLKINEDIPDSALDIEVPKGIMVIDWADETIALPPPRPWWAAYTDIILLVGGLVAVAVMLLCVWAWRRWH